MIKYGSIEYFELVDLSDRIQATKYNKLDLITLDRLRTEVTMKLQAIHQEAKIKKSNSGIL